MKVNAGSNIFLFIAFHYMKVNTQVLCLSLLNFPALDLLVCKIKERDFQNIFFNLYPMLLLQTLVKN